MQLAEAAAEVVDVADAVVVVVVIVREDNGEKQERREVVCEVGVTSYTYSSRLRPLAV